MVLLEGSSVIFAKIAEGIRWKEIVGRNILSTWNRCIGVFKKS